MKVLEHIHANFHRHHMHNKEIKGGGKFAPPPPANVHKIPPRNRVNVSLERCANDSFGMKQVKIIEIL